MRTCTLGHDLRGALRRLARQPGSGTLVVATLALAIGANGAVFSVVRGVLLRPLPVAGEERLALFWKRDPIKGFEHIPLLYPELETWRREVQGLEGLAAISNEGTWRLTLAGDEPSRIEVSLVSAGFFETVGVRPALGRSFSRDDERASGAGAALLAHGAWTSRFGADRGVLGETVTLGGKPYRIAGVLPEGWAFPETAEAWICVTEGSRAELDVLGRLAPDVGLEEARQEIDALVRRRAPEGREHWRVVATPLRRHVLGEVRTPLLLLLGAVGLLLAVACVNVANLLAVEAHARRGHFAVRAALGASAARLARQVTIEGAVPALAGGAAAVAVAWGGVRLLLALRPAAIPRLDGVTADASVLAFSAILTLATAVAAGLGPALGAARSRPAAVLAAAGSGTGGRGAGGPVSKAMKGLVVAEIALALMLAAGAGLLVRTFLHQLLLDRGFDAEHLLTAAVSAPGNPDPAAAAVFWDDLVARLEALPGLAAASPAYNRPFATSDGFDASYVVEGQGEEEAVSNPWANLEAVGPGYLSTLGLPLEEGRFFPQSPDRGDRGSRSRAGGHLHALPPAPPLPPGGSGGLRTGGV